VVDLYMVDHIPLKISRLVVRVERWSSSKTRMLFGYACAEAALTIAAYVWLTGRG
jgi:hypothetical protein